MENELITTLVSNSGVGSVLIILLVMLWRSGNFIAPLITNYVNQQIINQTNIVNTLHELSELQKVNNVRLEAIEQQLKLFEGLKA